MIARYEERKLVYGKSVWSGTYSSINNILHWHFENELLCVLKGTATVWVDEKAYEVKSGQMIFIRGGKVHYIRSEVGTLFWAVLFDYDITKDLLETFDLSSPLIENDYDLLSFRRRFLTEEKSGKEFSELVCKAELQQFFIEIFRREKKISSDDSDTLQADKASFRKLFDYVETEYRYATSATAAKYLGYTLSYFSRKFKSFFGMTFTDYLNRIKIEKAIALLRKQEEKISVIADKCGFNTIRNFNLVFKQVTGYTPKSLPREFSFSTDFERASGEYFNPTLSPSVVIPDDFIP